MMNKKAVTVLFGAGSLCLTLFRSSAQNKKIESEFVSSHKVFSEIAKKSFDFTPKFSQEHHHLTDELPRALSSSTDQTLLDWVVSSTNDHQVLDFSPENLTLHIAFLRLIGISTVSLNDLGRERGTKVCFLKIGLHLKDAEPKLLTSKEDMLSSILEFNTSARHIKISSTHSDDPFALALPSILSDSEITFKTHELEAFYEEIAHLSDNDIQEFATKFFKEGEEGEQQILIANLKKARNLCATVSNSTFNPGFGR